jgi:hypothetical protein
MSRNTLFLASPVRSGSTYIAEEICYRLLRDAGLQYFDLTRDAFSGLTDNSTAAEIKKIHAELFLDPSGWSTSKIHCAALSVITRESRLDETVREAFFGGKARWIFVHRRDKIAQAVSLATARKTGVWHVYEGQNSGAENNANVTTLEIQEALRAILLDDVYLKALSRNLDPERFINVAYEDVLAGGRRVTAAVIKLCGLDVKLRRDKSRHAAKIVASGGELKKGLADKFAGWLAENYHDKPVPARRRRQS